MAVETMASTLGKRTRAAYESTKQAIGKSVANLTGENNRRSSLRRREPEVAEDQDSNEPPLKKRNTGVTSLFSFADNTEDDKKLLKKQAAPPKKKRWLNQGLYAGQRQDFEVARIKGKSKKDDTPSNKKQRKLLPLPMFGFLDHNRDFNLPFDIYSALPRGQPKPDEWKKTRSNQFVGDSKEVWRHMSSNMPDSKCVCTKESGCDEDCLNRYMYYECDDRNCAVGPSHCTNRQFANLKERVKMGTKYNIGVEVQKYANKGFGVRACRSFEPHQIIVEYSGEIITQEECEDRMHNQYKDKSDYYLMTFDQNMIIDATRGSIARFVNHSCAPNCTMVKWTVNNKPRMALFAGDKGIMTGEELTYDYNFDPFSMKNVQACHCGAADCRGFLGPRPPKTHDKALSIAATAVNGVKRKVSELVGTAAGSNSPRSPAKQGYIRGPYKKRRVSEPTPGLGRKASAGHGRKGHRNSSYATDKTLVDKENKTPSTKSARSSSGSGTPTGDSLVPKKAAGIKRMQSMASVKSTQSTLESWFGEPGSTLKRAMSKKWTATPRGVQKHASVKLALKKRQSLPARLPGSRISGRLVDKGVEDLKDAAKKALEDGWVPNGVQGKGSWKWETVPA